jgi:hypothetical protein
MNVCACGVAASAIAIPDATRLWALSEAEGKVNAANSGTDCSLYFATSAIGVMWF